MQTLKLLGVIKLLYVFVFPGRHFFECTWFLRLQDPKPYANPKPRAKDPWAALIFSQGIPT